MRVTVEPTVIVDLPIPKLPVAVPPLAVAVVGRSFHQCTNCDAQFEIAAGYEHPSMMVLGASGQPNQRVVTIAGIEVHRCPFPSFEGTR